MSEIDYSSTPRCDTSGTPADQKQFGPALRCLQLRWTELRDTALSVKLHNGGVTMKFRFIASWGLVVSFLIACIPLLAHHGENNYDTSKAVVLKGATVTKWLWINPHVIVQVDAKDAQGNVQHWSAEASSPSTLQLKGWSESSFQPGDVITVYLFQSKTGRPVGRLNKIVLADGSELHDGQQGGKNIEEK